MSASLCHCLDRLCHQKNEPWVGWHLVGPWVVLGEKADHGTAAASSVGWGSGPPRALPWGSWVERLGTVKPSLSQGQLASWRGALSGPGCLSVPQGHGQPQGPYSVRTALWGPGGHMAL